MRKFMKALSGFLAVGILSSMVFVPSQLNVMRASADSNTGNIISNSGFESGTQSWTFTSGTVDSKNAKSGSGDAAINTSGTITQTILVPVTGTYDLSGWFIPAPGSSFGIKNGSTVIASQNLGGPGGPSSDYVNSQLSKISLNKGDTITVYVNGGMFGTVYADNLLLTRIDSDFVNLAVNPGFDSDNSYWTLSTGASIATEGTNKLLSIASGSNETASQTITAPLDGLYKLSVKAYGIDGDATLGIKSSDGTVIASIAIPQGTDYQTVILDNFKLEKDENAEIYIEGAKGVKADDFSLDFDLSKVTAGTPSAASASISGNVFVGTTLTGTYTYADTQNYIEAHTTYKWLISDTSDGTYTPIDGATGSTYSPTIAQAGKYIKFEVTPSDMYEFTGTAVQSSASEVILNLISNCSFESGSSSWSLNGATTSSDTTVLKPKAGSVQAVISATTTSKANSADQVVTVSQSGVYTFSVYTADVNQTLGGSVGIMRADGEKILNMNVPHTSSYNHLLVNNISLEKGDQIEVYANGGNGTTYIDDFELKLDSAKSAPVFDNIKSFTVANQIGSSTINTNNHTVSFTMPYGTDVTALTPTIGVSEGATTSVTGLAQSFVKKLVCNVTGSNGTVQPWTVICKTKAKGITIDSSSSEIKEAFNWACNKALSQVQTGKTGILNADERSTATSVGTFIPSYWAGYSYRSAFYIRDFAHQANGAHLLGLDTENFSMLKAFLSTASASSGWYPAWALNFDGSIFKLDHSSDTSFVREVPSEFELVELANNQYMWTGNKSYITDKVMLNFYKKAITDFIKLHDTKKSNGVAEGVGSDNDLNLGMASYNESGSDNLIESGDDIACEYAAFNAYANILKATGDTAGAAKYKLKAAVLKAYFNNTWGVAAGQSNYVRAYSASGKAFTDFGKENSWFMLLKSIVNPGTKTDNYISYMEQQLATSSGLPTNIEACTYLPDTYFQWSQNELAWKWMKYEIENRNTPHANSAEGVDGNYPEVSYTLVSQTVQGLMGISPDAPSNKVTTLSHLPTEINWLSLNDVTIGSHDINVKQQGATTTLTHVSGSKALTWSTQFKGNYAFVKINNKYVAASHATVNGVAISFTTVKVPVGATVVATASTTAAK